MKIANIDSSLITWELFSINPESLDEDEVGYSNTYCADGDGMVEVRECFDGHFRLYEQGDLCATFDSLKDALEAGQNLLAASYHEVFEDAKHWNKV